jgi:hypothetical protein
LGETVISTDGCFPEPVAWQSVTLPDLRFGEACRSLVPLPVWPFANAWPPAVLGTGVAGRLCPMACALPPEL